MTDLSKLLYVGVDHGITGAICLLGEHDIVEVFDMPTKVVGKDKKKKKNTVDSLALYKLLLPFKPLIAGFYHEVIHSSPQMGVTSSFNFGNTNGKVLAVCEILDCHNVFFTPQMWKKHFDLLKTDKEAACDKARLMFDASELLTLKKHHNRADAILIAAYGREKFKEFYRSRESYNESNGDENE